MNLEEATVCPSGLVRLENRPGITLQRVSADYRVKCALTGVPFTGKIVVDLRPGNWLLEYESFGNFIDSLKDKECIFEEVVRMVYDAVWELEPLYLRVWGEAISPVHPRAEVEIEGAR